MTTFARIEIFQNFPDAKSRAKALAIECGKSVDVFRTEGGFAVAVQVPTRRDVAQRNVAKPDADAKSEAQERYREARGERTSIRTSVSDDPPVGSCSTNSSASLERLTVAPRSRLIDEMLHAFRNAPREMLLEWAKATSGRFGFALIRRVDGGKELLLDGLSSLGLELNQAYRAMKDARLFDHLTARSKAFGAGSVEAGDKIQSQARKIALALQQDPAVAGSNMVVAALAFYYVGGGLDGDGGVPDLDIDVFGIGGHRSIFAHSIVAGAFVETGLFSLYDFLNRAYQYLPHPHDPLWDGIHDRLMAWLGSASSGASAGLAYHFGIDATVQPGHFRDLPFAVSMEVHQAILGASAISEAKAGMAGNATTIPAPSSSAERDPNDIMTGLIVVAAAIGAIFFGS